MRENCNHKNRQGKSYMEENKGFMNEVGAEAL